ncbi:MAG: family 10 glycosylhydrolase [Ignavibacteriales bacterium]|nr:family 10 glycosylhydrolase [Ignavibacteriales bacterium]
MAPSYDYYDPLVFACQEAHKRGMEIHAWFNPYRVKLSASSPQLAANNVAVQHPGWAITCPDGYTLLNPGLDSVRNHVARVIADVVRRYDIDGVHMDDYFYPYSEHSFGKLDLETFRLNPRGFSYPDSLAPWRRNNVNLLIKMIYDSVQAIKPVVKVGMSPFGIWKNGIPAGTSGTSGYDELYCDAVAWMSGKYLDYITPQLYWRFGGGQDYAKLQPWWASVTYGRHLYTGNYAPLGPSEIGAQINFNRATGAQGVTLFSARTVTTNSGGLMDSLKNGYFATAAVIPVMNWKDTLRPNSPANLQVSLNPGTGLYQLTWSPSTPATDGDTARRYLVYRFRKQTYQPADLDVATNLLALTGVPTVIPPARLDNENSQYSFAVSAFDRNNNESALSNVVGINSTVTTPLLASPANGEKNFIRGGSLSWFRNPTTMNYRAQVASSSDFTPTSLISTVNTTDSTAIISGLAPQSTYYWRVLGGNQGSTGTYSSAWSFKTGWPTPPVVLSPASGQRNVSRVPTFVWRKGAAASFRIRVTQVSDTPNLVVVDQTTSDTTFLCTTILTAAKNYSWILSATNAYGTSDWSAESRFQTGQDVTVVDRNGAVPTEFALSQNYPNPFNPTTNIQFAVAQTGPVSLRVYDVLGREVALLVDNVLQPGFYTARFEGHNSASGVYFYRLIASGFVEMKKMQLVK